MPDSPHRQYDSLEGHDVLFLHPANFHCEYLARSLGLAFLYNPVCPFTEFLQDIVLLLEDILEVELLDV